MDIKWVIVSIFVAGLIVGVCAWAVIVVESIHAILCLKPEARQLRYVRWNRFNAFPRPELFTEKGIVHRWHALRSLVWFLGALAISGTVGITAFALRHYGS